MTVFLLEEADGLGTGAIDLFSAFGDLLVAANDTGIGLGDGVDGRFPVTYARSENGVTHLRLDQLINGDFNPDYGTGSGPQSVDIVIFAAPDNFVLADGTFGVTNNGTALAPSNSGLAGSGLNPTVDCLVIYDNQLAVCVARDGTGGTLDLTLPGPVVLYHELSHAWRIVNNTLLGLGGGCNPSSPEEEAAITEENDMRTMLADFLGNAPVLRDPGIHCGGLCGGSAPSPGGCCIVASVVSGSPWSAQVQRLRAVRDQFLRRTETGFHFFEWLHHDYYGFSPQIAAMIAGDLDLRDQVLHGYVEPLLEFWTFMGRRADGDVDPTSPAEVGRAFIDTVPADHDDRRWRRAALRVAADYIRSTDRSVDDPMAALLHERALTSEIVRWALVEPLQIHGAALDRLCDRAGEAAPGADTADAADAADVAAVGTLLVERIDPWVGRLPIHPVWGGLDRARFTEELAVADRLLGTPDARRLFRSRLVERFPHVTVVATTTRKETPR